MDNVGGGGGVGQGYGGTGPGELSMGLRFDWCCKYVTTSPAELSLGPGDRKLG